MSVQERLDARSELVNGCLVWTGAVDKYGYGKIKVDGKTLKVHRVAYALYHQVEVPSSMDIDHACRNRACFAKDHLRMQTPSTNRSDGSRNRWRMWAELKKMDKMIRHLSVEES